MLLSLSCSPLVCMNECVCVCVCVCVEASRTIPLAQQQTAIRSFREFLGLEGEGPEVSSLCNGATSAQATHPSDEGGEQHRRQAQWPHDSLESSSDSGISIATSELERCPWLEAANPQSSTLDVRAVPVKRGTGGAQTEPHADPVARPSFRPSRPMRRSASTEAVWGRPTSSAGSRTILTPLPTTTLPGDAPLAYPVTNAGGTMVPAPGDGHAQQNGRAHTAGRVFPPGQGTRSPEEPRGTEM